MAEDAFPYGAFGRAIYVPDEKEWCFQKQLTRSNILESSLTAVTHRPVVAERLPREDETLNGTTTSLARRQIETLPRSLPEIEPAANSLPELCRLSSAVEGAGILQDVATGQLISGGLISVESSRRSVAAIAHSTGPTGGDLRVVTLAYRRHYWYENRHEELFVPTPHGEDVTWKGKGVPIQQVTFSQSQEEDGGFICVRYPDRLLIFRPFLPKGALHQDDSPIDVNLIYELSNTRFDSGLCMHASFNPWYSHQFATIGQGGRWIVWELEGKRSFTIKESACSTSNNGDAPSSCIADGWVRIAWLQNFQTVVVSTRYQVTLYSISENPQILQNVSLETIPDLVWLFDSVVLPSHLEYMAFLTDSHLVILKGVQSFGGEVVMNQVLRLRHYFGSDEPFLRLDTHVLDQGDVLLMIRNASSALVSYVVKIIGHGLVSVSEPSIFQSSETGRDESALTHCLGFQLQTVNLNQRKHHGTVSYTDAQSGNARQFCSAIVLHQNFLLNQTLLQIGGLGIADSISSSSRSDARSRARTRKAPREHFVVPDNLSDPVQSNCMRPQPDSVFARRSVLVAKSLRRGHANYELTARAVIDDEAEKATQLEDVLRAIQRTLSSEDLETTLPWKTLRDCVEGEVPFVDVETASQRITDLQGTYNGEMNFESNQAEAPTALTVRYVEVPSHTANHTLSENLAQFYDEVASCWIAPLPDDVNGRVRLAKHRAACRLAVEVILASRTICPTLPESTTAAPVDTSAHQTWDLAVRTANREVGLHDIDHDPLQVLQQPPPALPTPRTTPSVMTGSTSQLSTFSAPEISRLARYTSFSNPGPAALPRSITRMLSHWAPGSDPETYDWLSVHNRVNQQAEADEADSQLTERDRRRLQKQAERLLKKQRKENVSRQVQGLPVSSQQLPEVTVSNSQQVGSGRSMGGNIGGSSQEIGTNPLAPASQVVRGKFGGRPPARKKRRQGF